jgi:hypothetical protein
MRPRKKSRLYEMKMEFLKECWKSNVCTRLCDFHSKALSEGVVLQLYDLRLSDDMRHRLFG